MAPPGGGSVDWFGKFMSRSGQSLIWLLWVCFAARALFYASFIPLWEGYDEWGHLAFSQALAESGSRLPDPHARITREVQASLETAPLPWGRANVASPAAIVHDEYWRLPEAERRGRERRTLPEAWRHEPSAEGERIYEALQPPLYYWLMAAVLQKANGWPLADRVFLLRWVSAGIASLFIPLGFRAARRFFGAEAPALGVVAVAAAMPELLLNVGRVGNECLAVVLYTALVGVALATVQERPDLRRSALLGLLLGLGLLTKAYFLTAVPALVMLWGWLLWRRPNERRTWLLHGLAAAAPAVAIAGWWYGRNRVMTGTWTGLSEAVMLRELGLTGLLGRITQVAWGRALDSILFSHLWFGGWSGLMVRSWVYHVFYALAALGTAGLALQLGRERRLETWLLAGLYGSFWLGELYNVLLIFVSKGVSASMGWYLYAAVIPEVALAAAGLAAIVPRLWRRWVLPAGAALFALLDLYTVNLVSIPYYTGLIAHRPDGSLPLFHPDRWPAGGLSTVLGRLAVNKPEFLTAAAIAVLWCAYLAATVGLVVMGFRLGKAGAE